MLNSNLIRRWPLLLLALVVTSGGVRVSAQPSLSPTRRLIDQVGIAPPLGSRVPGDLEFVDAEGSTVRLRDSFHNRPVILHLVYYQCPMLCKVSSDGLLRALDTLSLRAGRDFSIVTVSFDPREGPELSAAARQIAIERFGREPVERGWQFLTGKEPEIEALCEAVGFRYKFDAATGQFAHASGVFILSADGTLSRFISGAQFAPRDLKLALLDAADGNVGTAADQVLMMCYMYDPATGKYGLAIISVLRVAGVATVVTMAAGIFILLRRERQRNSEHNISAHADRFNSPENNTLNNEDY